MMRRTSLWLVCAVLGPVALAFHASAEDRFAFLQRTGSYWSVAFASTADSSSIESLAATGEQTRVSWAPDGQHVASCSQEGVISLVSVQGGKPAVSELALEGTVDAVLSPEGSRLAFSVSPARSRDDNEIYLVRTDGSGRRRLTDDKRVQHEPAWHPDGQSVYFISMAGEEAHDIWKISLATGNVEQVTVGRGLHFGVAVREDGALAYSNNFTGNYEVWVQLPGESPRALTDHPAIDGYPSWSPDGTELLFESTRTGQYEIFRVGLDGGKPVQVTDTPAGARRPVWYRGVEGKP